MQRALRNRRRRRGTTGTGATSLAERLLTFSGEAVYAVDASGRCVYATEAAARLLGTSPALLRGADVHREHHGRPAEEVRAQCPLCGPVGEGLARGTASLTRADGAEVAVDYARAVLVHDGEPLTALSLQDLADRARAESALRQLEIKYRAVTESASDAIVSADAHGIVVGWNRGAQVLFGYEESEVLGRPLTLLIPERYREAHDRGMERFLDTSEPQVMGHGAIEVHALRKDGSELPVELSLSHWAEGDGRFFTGILRDITGRKLAEEALAREAGFITLLQRVSIASNESSDGEEALGTGLELVGEHAGWPVGHVWLVDDDGTTLVPSSIWVQPDDERFAAFREATGSAALQVGEGLPGRVLASGHPCWIPDVTADEDFPRRAAARASGLTGAFALPVMVGSRVMAVLEFFAAGPVEPDEALGEVMAQIGTQLGRVLEREMARQELTHSALHDPLTGLPNRSLLLDRLQVALAQRSRGRVAVVFVDLDHFKLVNDSLGHAAGDRLLCAAATRLRAVLRPGDTVARLGGDEFVVLAESVVDERDAEGLAERIAAALAEPFDLSGEEVFVTASLGIAVAEGAGAEGAEADAQSLLRDADAAMYRAKEDGRARHEMFDAVMRAGAVRRLETVNDLHRALEREQFVLHFQPQIDLRTHDLVGVEALLRWVHPERGLVPPMEFIPIAEETGLINDLGRWVLRAACRQGREWLDRFPDHAGLVMSVNLSGRQLSQSRLVAEVSAALTDFGFPPEQLVLEITESVLMNDTTAAVATLQALKDLGVRLAIDDFGTGYSSLTYLQRFPIDILKIDKSFIDGLGGPSVEESAVTRTIVALAKTLRLETVAEGVERSEHVRELQSLRCDLAQGYFFARPLDAGALTALMAQPDTPVAALGTLADTAGGSAAR